MKFETDAGLITADIKSETVVNLALYDPKDLQLDIKLQIEDKNFEISSLNTGVPHAVIFVDDIEKINVFKYGRLIRNHAKFAPAGTNVNFVQVAENYRILVRTFE
jgi:diaminopimelate epimerase